MIRIVQGRTDLGGDAACRRIEVRSPDGTCNPYLLAGGVLAAGLDGVRRKLDPGPAADYDIAHPEASGISSADLPPAFPRTLDAALDGLEADEPLRELLGQAIVDAYIKIKRIEWAKFMAHVSDWEHRYYVEFF
jgi:glutamine synthetase